MASRPELQTLDAHAQEPSSLLQPDKFGCPRKAVERAPLSSPQQAETPAIAGAQLHAVGSIADISANWSAKVVVASAAQVDGNSMHHARKSG